MTPNPQDSAVALEVERAIREALDAGPTPGPWLSAGATVYSLTEDRARSGPVNRFSAGFQSARQPWEAQANELISNARLVVACNPEAMRTLLAEIDRLRASQSDGTSGGWHTCEESSECTACDLQSPVGWRLVPVTPTKEMIEAAMHVKRVRLLEAVAQIRAGMDETEARTPAIVGEWEAMLAAAPKKSQGENHVG